MTPSNNLADRFDFFDSDEFLVEAAVEVGEFVGVDAELVQDRGGHVGRGDGTVGDVRGLLVGRADRLTRFDAGPGHQNRKRVRPVIAAGELVDPRRTAEFGRHYDERRIEQATLL